MKTTSTTHKCPFKAAVRLISTIVVILIIFFGSLQPTQTHAATYDDFWVVAVGGGGSGGRYLTTVPAGGGGAGEYFEDTTFSLDEGSYSITVGAGGSAPANSNGTNGNNGNNTSIGAALTVIGGGGGGGGTNPGLSGGSGGGGRSGAASGTGAQAGGASTAAVGFGNAGGAGVGLSNLFSTERAAGGGGGAGAVGADGLQGDAGDGGVGIASSITGSSVYRAGGGGGGAAADSTDGVGGNGGGGAGGTDTSAAVAGTANTGGGGGGGGISPYQVGAAGGSGVVIIRFPTDDIMVTDSTGASCSTVDTTDTVCVWNASGTFGFINTKFTRPQTPVLSSYSDPAVATLGSTPTEGNLLVVVAGDRGGGNADNFTISGSGWTKVISDTTEASDINARRTQVVWYKVAGASEPSSVTVDDGTSNSKTALIQEFQANEDISWSFETAISANTGTGSASPLSSGSTGSVSAGSQLIIGTALWRNQTNSPGSVAFSGLNNVQSLSGGSNQIAISSAFNGSVASGTKSTSLSWTGSGHEGNVGLLVFKANGISAVGVANQSFVLGQSPAPAATVTVTARGGQITAGSNFKLVLNPLLPLTFDTSVTDVTIGGTASDKVSSTITYEDSKTAAFNVTENLDEDETITVDGLMYRNFSEVQSALPALQLYADETLLFTSVGTIAINELEDIFSSTLVVADQSFFVGQDDAEVKKITITAGTDDITASSSSFQIKINPSANFSFNTSVTEVTLGGTAADKATSTVTYPDAKTVSFTILEDLLGGDILTIEGLEYSNFTAPNAPVTALELHSVNFQPITAAGEVTFDGSGGYPNAIATDGDYLYAGGQGGTAPIRRYNLSDLSYVDESPGYEGEIAALVIAGNYIYAGGASTSSQPIRRYNLSDLSYVDESPSYGSMIWDMVVDDTYIYAISSSTGSAILRLDLSDLSFVDQSPFYPGSAHDMAIDASYVYLAGDTGTIRRYSLSDLSFVDESPSSGSDFSSIAIHGGSVYAVGGFSNLPPSISGDGSESASAGSGWIDAPLGAYSPSRKNFVIGGGARAVSASVLFSTPQFDDPAITWSNYQSSIGSNTRFALVAHPDDVLPGTEADLTLTGLSDSSNSTYSIFSVEGFEYDSQLAGLQEANDSNPVVFEDMTVPAGWAILLHGHRYGDLTAVNGDEEEIDLEEVVYEHLSASNFRIRGWWINDTGSDQDITITFDIDGSYTQKIATVALLEPLVESKVRGYSLSDLSLVEESPVLPSGEYYAMTTAGDYLYAESYTDTSGYIRRYSLSDLSLVDDVSLENYGGFEELLVVGDYLYAADQNDVIRRYDLGLPRALASSTGTVTITRPPNAGGTDASIGGNAPSGQGVRSGGGSSGGGGVGETPDGDNIAPDPNFFRPTANSEGGIWSNPSLALNSDGLRAVANNNGSFTVYNFDFNIPSTNTVNGIEVKVDTSDASDPHTLTIELSWNGGSSYSDSYVTPSLPDTDVVYSFGGPSDTWGRSWTPSEFGNENFEVRLTSSGSYVQVDGIEVRVYHQATGGGGGGGGGL